MLLSLLENNRAIEVKGIIILIARLAIVFICIWSGIIELNASTVAELQSHVSGHWIEPIQVMNWIAIGASLLLLIGWYTRFNAGILLVMLGIKIALTNFEMNLNTFLERDLLLVTVLLAIIILGPGDLALDNRNSSE